MIFQKFEEAFNTMNNCQFMNLKNSKVFENEEDAAQLFSEIEFSLNECPSYLRNG